MIRKNVSLSPSTLKLLEPLIQKHGGNLSAAIREAVELAHPRMPRESHIAIPVDLLLVLASKAEYPEDPSLYPRLENNSYVDVIASWMDSLALRCRISMGDEDITIALRGGGAPLKTGVMLVKGLLRSNGYRLVGSEERPSGVTMVFRRTTEE